MTTQPWPCSRQSSIVTNTGWKITIDRGLDMSQRFEGGTFPLEQALQEARLTRGAEISYLRSRRAPQSKPGRTGHSPKRGTRARSRSSVQRPAHQKIRAPPSLRGSVRWDRWSWSARWAPRAGAGWAPPARPLGRLQQVLRPRTQQGEPFGKAEDPPHRTNGTQLEIQKSVSHLLVGAEPGGESRIRACSSFLSAACLSHRLPGAADGRSRRMRRRDIPRAAEYI